MLNSPQPLTPPPSKEVYGIFTGMIDQTAVGKIAGAAAVASSNMVTHCHLVFQSAGGTVQDGIALYNIFRAFPVPLTLYNIGSVSSAGVTAYLGATNRVASKLATFMIHRTVSPLQAMTSDRLQATLHSVDLDDRRTEQVLSALKLTTDHRTVHKTADLWFSAEEAEAIGLVTQIGEFAPPKGTQLFFIGFP